MKWTFSNKIAFWSLVLGILTFIILLISKIEEKQSSFEISKENAKKGILVFATKKFQNYLINLGSNALVVSEDELSKGLNLNSLIMCNSDSPYILRMEKGTLKLSAKFFNLDNEIIGEIKDNEWGLNNNFYKMNYDQKAIEVIDNYDVVVMQVTTNNNNVSINGILHCDEIMMICNGNSIIMQGLNINSEKQLIEKSGLTLKQYYLNEGRKLKRIFEYTGKDWLGKRVGF